MNLLVILNKLRRHYALPKSIETAFDTSLNKVCLFVMGACLESLIVQTKYFAKILKDRLANINQGDRDGLHQIQRVRNCLT